MRHRVPVLPVFLRVMWLSLNGSLAPGQIALGVLFAGLVTLAVAALRPVSAWPRRFDVAVRLFFVVLVDVVRSNIAVGSVILGASRRQPHVGFMKIPLELRDPHGLAVLAMIITACPGSVWAGHDRESNVLTLHILDLQDEAAWIRTVKQRYERPLMEIFG